MCVVTPSLHRRHTSSLVLKDRNKYKAHSVNYRHVTHVTNTGASPLITLLVQYVTSVCVCFYVTSVFERKRERVCVSRARLGVCVYIRSVSLYLTRPCVCVCHERVGVYMSMTRMCLSVCLCHERVKVCMFMSQKCAHL